VHPRMQVVSQAKGVWPQVANKPTTLETRV
jgi:hypothetical protein